MKKQNSIKIIFIGAFLSILFSIITYQNFTHNIEEIIEEQEIKSNKLIDHNVEMILENINNTVKNTIKISINNEFLNATKEKNSDVFIKLKSKVKKNLELSFHESTVEFLSERMTIKNSNFDASFTMKNNDSYYTISYPVYNFGEYRGRFKIDIHNREIINLIKKNIDAEVGLFINKSGRLINKNVKNLPFKNYALINSTDDSLINIMIEMDNFSLEDNEEIFSVGKKLIEIDSIKLSPEEKVLLVFNDVTSTYKSIENTINDFIFYFILVLIVLLLISYYIYSSSNKTIMKQYYSLIVQKEESEKLLKVKSEFLANMSHEIRTPLNAINGFIHLIEEENKDKNIFKYIATIQDSSKNLLEIIEDILDLSKIESGKVIIHKSNFEARSEFEIISYLFDTKLSSKNIQFILNIDENVPQFLYSDSLRLKQIISNLLGNAIKFTDDGKKIILNVSFENDYLKISVKDEGIGISNDRQKQIFEPFTQADNSTTRKYGGTGLGLTISSQLIKLLGGKLMLDSDLGKGSTFYFSIPTSIGKRVNDEKKEQIIIDVLNKKILLVEDNKSNQLFMKVLFKKLDLKYDIANDGCEAVSMFKENNYNLILMDENMPNMSGIEATQEIRKIEKNMNKIQTPIIALTANAIEGDREKFLESGMNEYLAKPINKSKLEKLLLIFLK